jgi:hypothetical protein
LVGLNAGVGKRDPAQRAIDGLLRQFDADLVSPLPLVCPGLAKRATQVGTCETGLAGVGSALQRLRTSTTRFGTTALLLQS